MNLFFINFFLIMDGLPSDLLQEQFFPSLTLLMLRHTCHTLKEKIKQQKFSHRNIAKQGYLNILKWCHGYGFKPNKWTFVCTAKGGHLDILEWLQEIKCEENGWATIYAAQNGYLNVLKWMKTNRCILHQNAINYAASSGHFDVVKWLKKTGCPTDERLSEAAARTNNMELLIWCYIYGLEISICCVPAASKNGNVNMIKYLLDHGSPVNREPTTRVAVNHGRMNVLNFLHDMDFIDEECLISQSIHKENLKVLKWAKEKGYQIVLSDYAKANINDCKNKNMINWLKDNNYI
jgi:hypothetical protein